VSALILPAAPYPTDEPTLEPETTTDEHAIEPPRSETVSPNEPEPHQPDRPETVQQQADASDTRTPEHVLEPTPPTVPTLQPQPPAVDASSATLPPLPRTEPRLEDAAGVPSTALPPQSCISAPAQVELTRPWRHELPLRPSPPTKVEALSPLPRTESFEGNAAVHSIPLPPQPAVSAQAHVELAEAWPREAPLRPSPPAEVEAPRYLGRALKLAAAVLLALAGSVLLLVILYRWVDPPTSTLMLGQRLGGTPISQRWVPLARISPNLPVAVILSEDARFCRHSGVDWGELRDAMESASDGVARGGSTISMQVVKNLFLWPSKSYLRKALEIPLAYLIEVAWSKQRVLEIYLNIAEWGPGVFGAEAAARYHFRKPASLLGPREAALLAVSLPNPFERHAGRPGPGTQRLADNLLLRMRAARATAGCVRPRPTSE